MTVDSMAHHPIIKHDNNKKTEDNADDDSNLTRNQTSTLRQHLPPPQKITMTDTTNASKLRQMHKAHIPVSYTHLTLPTIYSV